MTPFEQQAYAYLSSHEGVCDFMYLDTVGLVTVGIGCMIPTEDAAALLAMRVRGLGRPAAPDECRAEWRAVKEMPAGKIASFYLGRTRLYMAPDDLQALCLTRMREFVKGLHQAFPGFDAYPVSAQVGLLDMAYSMGLGFVKGYPHFCEAVRRKDWKTAAEHSHRNGVGDKRNADCAALFREAA